jgi:hypothetical protein
VRESAGPGGGGRQGAGGGGGGAPPPPPPDRRKGDQRTAGFREGRPAHRFGARVANVLTSSVVKRASLVAGAVTLVAVPLVMLIAVAPTSEAAAGGFVDLHLSFTDVVLSTGLALVVFSLCFGLAAHTIARAWDASARRR